MVVSTFMPISFLRYMPRFLLPPSSAPTPRPPRDPTTVSLSFVRDLEQFTGCSAASGTMLDFWVGPYREFLSDVRKQAKIGMIVLVCGEHENDEEFKRDVLCDPELVRFIKEKEIMVWGADIRSKEGYQGRSLYRSMCLELTIQLRRHFSLLLIPRSLSYHSCQVLRAPRQNYQSSPPSPAHHRQQPPRHPSCNSSRPRSSHEHPLS